MAISLVNIVNSHRNDRLEQDDPSFTDGSN